LIEDIKPDQDYSLSRAAQLLPSARREGSLHPSTLNKAAVKGVKYPDGTRHHLRVRRTPGGFLIRGSDLIEFLNSYDAAYGAAFDPDPSDSSGPGEETAAGHEATAEAKARAIATAAARARKIKAAAKASKARARARRATVQ
jgi:hypothetical protein